jgi:hypothetical protein
MGQKASDPAGSAEYAGCSLRFGVTVAASWPCSAGTVQQSSKQHHGAVQARRTWKYRTARGIRGCYEGLSCFCSTAGYLDPRRCIKSKGGAVRQRCCCGRRPSAPIRFDKCRGMWCQLLAPRLTRRCMGLGPGKDPASVQGCNFGGSRSSSCSVVCAHAIRPAAAHGRKAVLSASTHQQTTWQTYVCVYNSPTGCCRMYE